MQSNRSPAGDSAGARARAVPDNNVRGGALNCPSDVSDSSVIPSERCPYISSRPGDAALAASWKRSAMNPRETASSFRTSPDVSSMATRHRSEWPRR